MSRVERPVMVDYPVRDGKRMAETTVHLEATVDARHAFSTCFRHRQDVWVGADLFVYHEEGNPRAVVAPDVFVAIGVRPYPRDTYKLWEEDDRVPALVLEVTSRSTRGEDEGKKRKLYARLGVREYWLYDPQGEYLSPRLQGYRLSGGAYRRIEAERVLPAGDLRMRSELGVELRLEGGRLRYYDLARGRYLRTPAESEEMLEETEEMLEEAATRLDEEAAARRAAEARIAELEARLRRS